MLLWLLFGKESGLTNFNAILFSGKEFLLRLLNTRNWIPMQNVQFLNELKSLPIMLNSTLKQNYNTQKRNFKVKIICGVLSLISSNLSFFLFIL